MDVELMAHSLTGVGIGTVVCAAILVSWPVSAAAQQPAPLRVDLPPVTVTAQKEPADRQRLPVSVTAVPLNDAAITTISDAGVFAPNTFFSEFQARKLSFPHFRGISSGPGNPAITTYVDGVPMLHTNASSLELVDVDQVEFVRGGQSALFGRNALGGIVNVTSTRPSLAKWTGSVSVPFGNYGAVDSRGSISGPLSGKAAISIAAGRSVRDGFTTNDVTGADIDTRGNTFGKAQLLWTPASNWETRFIVSAERARDGDYALVDLGSLRRQPFHAQRDFEGRTDRDVRTAAFLSRRTGARINLSTVTGVVNWKATDDTDLDYSPYPLFTRLNDERATQFSQEVRLASANNAPIRLSSNAVMRWQAGLFFFTQNYDQDAVNTYAPFVLSSFVPFSVQQHSPTAALDDSGVGVFGQGTVTLHDRIDVSIGARVDRESKDASLVTSYTPAIAPSSTVKADRSFSNISPQASVSYRMQPSRMLYASVGSGYKSGGFNPASPAGAEAYGEEHAWQFEGGAKTTWADGRLLANAAAFYIKWNDLQMNLPNPQVPAQFYTANVGRARSAGVEFELTGRPAPGLDLFGVLGYTNARFKDGSISSGLDVSGNTLPSAPDVTATLGASVDHRMAGSLSLLARGEVVFVGSYKYDDANTEGQDGYALTNVRTGVRKGRVTGEVWIRNAFDRRYVPIAFAYPGVAPSGFVGEMGRPRTFGASVRLQF